MKNLLEHDVANTSSPLKIAFERDRTELKTSEYGCEYPLFCPEVQQETWFWFAVRWHRQEAEDARCSGACLPNALPSRVRSLLRGLCDARRQARSSALLRTLRLRFPPSVDPP